MAEGLTMGGIGAVDNSSAETTTDATPRRIAAFDVDGPANRITRSAAAGTITIIEAGTYDVVGHCCFIGTINKTYKIQVYKDTTAIGVSAERTLDGSGSIGSVAFRALGALTAGQVISAYHWSTDGGSTFTAKQIFLTAERKW